MFNEILTWLLKRFGKKSPPDAPQPASTPPSATPQPTPRPHRPSPQKPF